MKFTQASNIRFTDDDQHETVRKNVDTRITELQTQANGATTAPGRALGGGPHKVTSSQTYTPDPAATLAIFTLVGGGGAGGGAQGGGGAAAGGGGASGVTTVIRVKHPVNGKIVIGGGGTPGAPGSGPGGAGGDTTLVQGNITYTAKGGGGGGGMAQPGLAVAGGGIPQAGSTADLWFAADGGRMGFLFAGSTWSSGNGGSGPRGIGAAGQTGSIAAAASGTGIGAGGAGGAATAASAAGGGGAPGGVFYVEYTG